MQLFMLTIIFMIACGDSGYNWDGSEICSHQLIMSQFKICTQTEWDNHCQEL